MGDQVLLEEKGRMLRQRTLLNNAVQHMAFSHFDQNLLPDEQPSIADSSKEL
jgi:hypothetical protein